LHFHTIIHPKLTEKENGKRNAPTPFDLKGGSEWFNSGKCMITVHRENPEYNEAEIYFNKIKPRSNGEVGKMLIKFDKATLCYYLDRQNGNQFTKEFAKDEPLPMIKTIANQFPKQLELENVPNLISASEKMRIANEKNNLPF
jgi:hypothetical protein